LHKQIIKGIKTLNNGMMELKENGVHVQNDETLRTELVQKAQFVGELIENLDKILIEPDDSFITWIQLWRKKLSLFRIG